METGEQVEGIFGDKLYQRLGKAALPILVNLAKSGQTIFYSEMAEELSLMNIHDRPIHHRHIGRIVGSVADTLIELGEEWEELIPPISAVVINKNTGQPGEGCDYFLRRYFGFRKVPEDKRSDYVLIAQHQVFGYGYWDDVLADLGVDLVTIDSNRTLCKQAGKSGGGGEGPEHKRLKRHVHANPNLIFPWAVQDSATERGLASGDCLDVYFQTRQYRIGIEVKSRISCEMDILRGIFQCVKYQAILEAEEALNGGERTIETYLVIEGKLTPMLMQAKNVLGVSVIEGVKPG